jgi:predicted RNA-binding Zn-ribbon protein involved in translation (DUF1610 family)
MLCPKCGASLSIRKSERAAYDAPQIHLCLKCGYIAVKQGNDVKPLDGNRL